ncbi:hypothetical protein HPP92_000758 [Vanilla planifolia]|uniref:Uncharacterized protein n=1 Tax=Vanilla planifolia TaxID=51239 RepID=A0A835S2U3_VANPL|nr:hypothetical protein HPP92_000758 [Vanilla planifolia]
MLGVNFRLRECKDIKDLKLREIRNVEADTYKKLELHVCGKLVATATRDPPHSKPNGESMADNKDQINVFLHLNMNSRPNFSSPNYPSTVDMKLLLGTITGLGTHAEEGMCSVYDQNGRTTHFIIKHRTLMVKHMHWFRIGEHEFPTYECRCSRPRLPPSKFWLFEPRSNMHDIGGWYVETFGQNKMGRTVHCRRHWDGVNEHSETKLHPAMYLFALAYRTLDFEDEKGRKKYIRDLLEPKLQNVLRWCRRIL